MLRGSGCLVGCDGHQGVESSQIISAGWFPVSPFLVTGFLSNEIRLSCFPVSGSLVTRFRVSAFYWRHWWFLMKDWTIITRRESSKLVHIWMHDVRANRPLALRSAFMDCCGCIMRWERSVKPSSF